MFLFFFRISSLFLFLFHCFDSLLSIILNSIFQSWLNLSFHLKLYQNLIELTLFCLSNLSYSSFFFASSAFLLASNSSLLFCIANVMLLVPEGFYPAFSSEIEARFFINAALNLSIGGAYYPSLRYSLSRPFELVLVKLGDLG